MGSNPIGSILILWSNGIGTALRTQVISKFESGHRYDGGVPQLEDGAVSKTVFLRVRFPPPSLSGSVAEWHMRRVQGTDFVSSNLTGSIQGKRTWLSNHRLVVKRYISDPCRDGLHPNNNITSLSALLNYPSSRF